MPQLDISLDMYERLQAFQALAEQLLGEPTTVEQCAEGMIVMGMRAILDGIWRPQEPNALIETLQNLAIAHPRQVYPFLAEVLKSGEQIQQDQERNAPVFGLRAPAAVSNPGD